MTNLEIMLKYVSEHNSFYRISEMQEDLTLEKRPIIDRFTVQKLKKKILSEEYLGLNSRNLITLITSGSSGQPLRVYWDVKDYYKSMVCLWRRRYLYYGISPTSTVLNFNYNLYNNVSTSDSLRYYQRKNILSVNKASLSNEKAMHELVVLLNDMNIDWIYVQPSILERILNYYLRHKIEFPKVKYIETAGEVLSEKLRNNILYYTGITVTNMYGSEEMNGIAIECPYGNMHVLSENVIVECAENDCVTQTGKGSAIITNLHNRAMPFIRYNQGDVISLSEMRMCQCGFCDQMITNIEGRERTAVTIAGKILDTTIITEVVESVNNLLEYPIYLYNFVYLLSDQKLIGYIKLEELYKKWERTVSQELNKEFKKRGYSGLNIEINYNDAKIDYNKKQSMFIVR